MATLDKLRHLTVEEREQQRADVRSINVGIGHNNYAVIPQLVGVEIISAGSLKVILLGVCFMLIVYYIPRGVVGRVETLAKRLAPGGGASNG